MNEEKTGKCLRHVDHIHGHCKRQEIENMIRYI